MTRRFANGFQGSINWTWALSDNGTTGLGARYQHAADGTVSQRDDWAKFVEQNKNQGATRHIFKGNWVWDLPDLRADGPLMRAVGLVVNDWNLSGIFTADSGAPYSANFSYQSGGTNVNLTGSNDYAAKVRLVGDPGSGCSSNQYQQFNTAAFAGPVAPSDGLESSRNYLVGCGDRVVDLAIARNFRMGRGRAAQIRFDIFNAFNIHVFNARSTSMTLTSPTNQTLVNAQYLPDGTLDPAKVQPRNAGFGAVTGSTGPGPMQAQFRFSF